MKKRFKEHRYTNTDIQTPVKELGQSIEQQLRKIKAENQPIPGVFPELFTPAEAGVIPDMDVRTDRFEIAYNAKNKYEASETAKAAYKNEYDRAEEGAA